MNKPFKSLVKEFTEEARERKRMRRISKNGQPVSIELQQLKQWGVHGGME
jgi:hypothetical protein